VSLNALLKYPCFDRYITVITIRNWFRLQEGTQQHGALLNCVKRKGEGEKQIFAVSIGTYQKVRFSNLRYSSEAAVRKGLRSVERLDP